MSQAGKDDIIQFRSLSGTAQRLAERSGADERANFRPSSGADFDPPPGVLEPRAGEVAAMSRPRNWPGERRSGPRIAAEAKEARPDHPPCPFMRVDVLLSLSRARLRKDAEPDDGGGCERDSGFAQSRSPIDRGPPARARLSDSARNSRPQDGSSAVIGKDRAESYRAVARRRAPAPDQPRAAARSLTAATNQSGAR